MQGLSAEMGNTEVIRGAALGLLVALGPALAAAAWGYQLRDRRRGVAVRKDGVMPVEFRLLNWARQMLRAGYYDAGAKFKHPPRHVWWPRLVWPWSQSSICWYCGLQAGAWWR
jgi:hypothetical protein